MKGADVKAFQRLLNLRFDAWTIDRRIAESGVYDAETREAARQVTQALGLLPHAYEHGITPALRSVIRTPSRRTPTQTKRAKARAPYRAKLRARYGEKPAATVATAARHRCPPARSWARRPWRSRSPRSGTASGSRPPARSARTPTRSRGRAATTTSATRTRTRTTSPTAARRRPGWTRPRCGSCISSGFKSYRLKEPINTSRGVTTIAHGGHRFRVQVIYRGSGAAFGGNHLNHIHIGVKRVG